MSRTARFFSVLTIVFLFYMMGLSSLYATSFFSSGTKKASIQASANVMTFDSLNNHFNFINGNLGIGASNPSAAVVVSGTVSAFAMTVSSTITANSFVGNGSGLTNIEQTPPDSSIQNSMLSAGAVTAITGVGPLTVNLDAATASFSGTVTADFFAGNGSSLTGIDTSLSPASLSNLHLSTGNFTAVLSGGSPLLGSQAYFSGSVTLNRVIWTGSQLYLGNNAGIAITTGTSNVMVGDDSGSSTTSGSRNTFFGDNTGSTGTTFSDNTFLGYYAGKSATGSDNTYFGSYAGDTTTTGHNNTYIGKSAGDNTNTGHNNVSIGEYAGGSLTTGYHNTYLGRQAGRLSSTGINNVIMGQTAGYKVYSSSANVSIGMSAGENMNGAQYNLFLGFYSGYKITSGKHNVAVGESSFYKATTAQRNVAFGSRAGYSLLTGTDNIFLGHNAGYNELGSLRLYIDQTNTSTPLVYGEFDTDYVQVNGTMNVTGKVTIGVTSNTSAELKVLGDIEYTGMISDISDLRYKESIASLQPALSALLRLQGRSYQWRHDSFSYLKFKKGLDIGVIAQEVEPVFPEVVQASSDGSKRVAYHKLIAPIISAIQELRHEQQRDAQQFQEAFKAINTRQTKQLKRINDLAHRLSEWEER